MYSEDETVGGVDEPILDSTLSGELEEIRSGSDIEAERPEPIPDIKAVLDEAIARCIDVTRQEELRRARWAESIGELNPELERVITDIIGIKMLGYQQEQPELPTPAEEIFLRTIEGDAVAQKTLHSARELASGHDTKVRHLRIVRRDEMLQRELGMSQEQIEDTRTPEVVSYDTFSIVHATDHEPIRHQSDGQLHIADSFTARDLPRSTVHMALNHLVESHWSSSDWSGKRVIVVAPLRDVNELNSEPTGMIGHDTWFEVPAGDGLTLPDSTIIIKPGADKPIQLLETAHEIRYKNAGITTADVDELLEQSGDYELSQVGHALGYTAQRHSRHGEKLPGTNKDMFVTELSPEHRQQVQDALVNLIRDNQEEGIAIYCQLARMVAVRLALERQNKVFLEPKTIMEAHFMSPDIDEDLDKFANSRGMAGHHSETELGRLEKRTLGVSDQLLDDPSARSYMREQVIEHIDELSMATLQMYYRLGLL